MKNTEPVNSTAAVEDLKADIKLVVSEFESLLKNDINGRYKSYEHCREFFLLNRPKKENKELMALHLYSYLASWGMLRNSFLMQKDYLFNQGIVEILYDSKYDSLINLDFYNVSDGTLDLIFELKDDIKNYYLNKTYFKDGTNEMAYIENVTDTLVTKIIMGTFACVPAYDQYLVNALGNYHIVKKFNKKSLRRIFDFLKVNKKEIDSIDLDKKLYTPMKIADMFFWESGFQK